MSIFRYVKDRMRITAVDIPKEQLHYTGLAPIKMNRLGQFVVLAGKNGSGKTRILDKIGSLIQIKPSKSTISANLKAIKEKGKSINYYKQLLSQGDERQEIILKAIKDAEQEIQGLENAINWPMVETSEASDVYRPIHFVPRNLDLQDPFNLSGNQLQSNARLIERVGIDQLNQSTFAKIQAVQNRWFSATHQHISIAVKEKQQSIDEYDALHNLIRVFLGTEIGRTIDGQATLFGFPLGQSDLSDGQKIILQLVMAIFSQSSKLKDVILILDEPENHLHPSAVIQIIHRFRESVPDGQIWIATHSVPLLAHFKPTDIWYVEQGKVEFGGSIPEKVLHSLLGDEESIEKIKDFLSLPAAFASSRYAYESLFAPEALMTESNDPQSVQVAQAFETLLKEKESLRVLDMGAGKGRILANVFDYSSAYAEDFKKKIDYVAFDEYDTDKDVCMETIAKVYGNADKRYFNTMDSLLSSYDKHSFDVIIMCNVLHEIDPMEWLKVFGPKGQLTQLVNNGSCLLLVEDTEIPHGEKPYQNGFLVLTTPAVKEFFKILEPDTRFTMKEEREGRLKCHYIPGDCLKRPDADSRKAALESVSLKAKEEIEKVRKVKNPTYKHGKQHGFWVQQFANAQLSLTQLAGH